MDEPASSSSAARLPGIPGEAVVLFVELFVEAAIPAEVLRTELREHVREIQAAAGANEFLDSALALQIARACEGLLEEAARRGTDEARRLAQAATRYFILDDDGEHDLESVCGLDDDAAVCNAVARHFERLDLLIL